MRAHQGVAARPIDLAAHSFAHSGQFRALRQRVPMPTVDASHLDRLLTHPEPAHIVRLAAIAGVEYRAIQLDGALIGVLRGYVRAEFAAITIVLV